MFNFTLIIKSYLNVLILIILLYINESSGGSLITQLFHVFEKLFEIYILQYYIYQNDSIIKHIFCMWNNYDIYFTNYIDNSNNDFLQQCNV